MEITITATLTDEKALQLAKEKWYQDKIYTIIDSTVFPVITEEIDNPETIWEFLKKVYDNLFINDVTQVFLNVSNRELEEQKRQQEELIRQNVTNSITSSIS